MSSFPITSKGLEKMQAELKHLKEVERPSITKAIGTAREHGDLKENAEYHSAREKQSFVEGRILDFEDKISRAQVINPGEIQDSQVRFSATVTLFDLDLDNEVKYTIVSEYEANINHNLISISSPIALGLIGKGKGDEAIINTPKGEKSYEVLKVEYIS